MWRIRALGSRDCDGRTPLHYAAINGSKAQLSVMLAKKYKGRFVARDAVGATTSNSSKKTQNSHAASNAKRGVNESEPPKDLVLRHVVYNTLTGEAVGKLESGERHAF
jgi:ankyrin repeat protein